jgi:hypothetical protein
LDDLSNAGLELLESLTVQPAEGGASRLRCPVWRLDQLNPLGGCPDGAFACFSSSGDLEFALPPAAGAQQAEWSFFRKEHDFFADLVLGRADDL